MSYMETGLDADPLPKRRGSARALPGTGGAGLAQRPLPWPPAGVSRRRALAIHAHRCVGCGADFRCPGPDDTGLCAPVCPPCYWFELGMQLKVYSAVVAALSRRRTEIERRIGSAACRNVQRKRQRLSREQKLMAAFPNRTVRSHNGAHRNGLVPGFLTRRPR
jgi:hypothetical protein